MVYTPAATAERSGFSLDTLRYYERIGLLFDIDRTPGGQRVFTDGDLEWLGVLRCLRDTGMPIAHMLRYAELCREGEGTMAERQAVLEQHAVEVEQRIADLQAQQKHLSEKIAWYRSQTASRV
jgi:DNA-binding transcriptional MerR regulator